MTRTRDVLIVLVLGLCGFAFTWFRWEVGLSFSVDFMFGSAFVMLAIARYGLWGGLLASVLTNAATIVMYGHPWAFLIFVGEALFVGLAVRTRRDRLILFDAVYWVAAAPFIWLLYSRVVGLQADSTLLFLAKQFVNSTLNALLATILCLTIRLARGPQEARPTFGALVFAILMSIVLLPSSVFLVLTIRDNVAHHEAQMVERAVDATAFADVLLGPALNALDRGGAADAAPLDAALASTASRISGAITVLDGTERVLASTLAGVTRGERLARFDTGDVIALDGGVRHWIPAPREGEDPLNRWWRSVFVARSDAKPGRPWSLVVEVPAEPFIRASNRSSLIYSTVLAVFVLTAIALSEWLSRRLTGPVVQLQAVTQAARDRQSGAPAGTAWPTSRIREVQNLVNDVRDLHLTLEQRVERRTRELARSEAMYRDVLEGVQMIAVQLDADGRVTFGNEFVLRLLGWTRDELVGRNWFDVCLPPDEAQVVTPIFQASVRKNESFPPYYENRIVTRTGEPRLVAWHNVTLRDDQGRITGTTSIGNDITDARAAQEALQASEERFSRVFREAPLVITLSDLETGRFIDVNDTTLEVLGFSRDEVIGRTPTELGLTDPDERARMVDALRRDGRLRRYERVVHTRDGRTLSCNYWAEIINIGGRDTLLSMLEDNTSRKLADAERARLEEQLNQALKMEAVGRLAGGVAHDFNNNLTTMMMQLSMLLAEDRIDADTRAALEEVMAAARRSADLTHQLLMFGRKSVLQIKPLDMHEVTVQLLAMLRRLLGETIQVLFESAGKMPTVLADRALVEQAIVNLAINARDAMPTGGQLRIALADVVIADDAAPGVEGSRPGRFVRISVTDSGLGMDDATRARLFEPFFTTKGAGRGTGLGLASVYGVVAQHQGWVDVDTAPGAGSTFRLFLPVA